MNIGNNIKELRKEKNLTQSELAKLLFVSQDTISLWECNKSTPSAEMLVKIADIFEVKVDYILDRE